MEKETQQKKRKNEVKTDTGEDEDTCKQRIAMAMATPIPILIPIPIARVHSPCLPAMSSRSLLFLANVRVATSSCSPFFLLCVSTILGLCWAPRSS